MTSPSTLRHRIFYKSLPKVELHRHLEGSLRLSTMLEVARDFALDLPYKDTDKMRSLVQVRDGEPFTAPNFLKKFETLRQFYQSAEVIKRFAREAIADAAADNIRYLELRFTPVALTRIRGFPLAEATDWVIEAVRHASKEYGVATKLIASVNRHESLDLAEQVTRLAIDRMGKDIVALDLAGGEADYPGESFASLFREAKEAGLKITAHAGEWGGPENIIMVIEKLGAQRIGHGVRVLENGKAAALARERGVTFEVCPTSNYQSGVVPALNQHPLAKMIEAGLVVTINTDDPGISQIDLSDEYELACESLGLSLEQLEACILNAARAAFTTAKESKKMAKEMEKEFKEKSKQ